MGNRLLHAIEVSVGLPSLFHIMHQPGDMNNGQTMDAERLGQRLKTVFPQNASLLYAYRLNEKWEIGGRFTLNGFVFTRSQYPSKGEGYDWKADPERVTTEYESRGIIPSVLARYTWKTTESSQWYSTFGLGWDLGGDSVIGPLVPDLIPVGVHIGKKRFYFVGELSLGLAGTGLLFGLGYRM